ncbi:MAG TPA: hypothetical protein VFJ43_02790, partial [Bacteroidia bacterium]|nr:hypothetical protein [Bacteroidia bacterium]
MKSLLTPIFLLLTITSFAQKVPFTLSARPQAKDTLSPLQVVQEYISPYGFPNKLEYFCCELYKEWYADSTLGQHLPKRVQRTTQLIFQDTGHATVAVWLHDTVTSLDIYFYLVKKRVWTIYAARSLVMKQSAEDELKRLDSIPEKNRGSEYTKMHGHTYAFEYTNLQLWDNSDTVLVEHFIKNKKNFLAMQKRLEKKGFCKTDSLVVK